MPSALDRLLANDQVLSHDLVQGELLIGDRGRARSRLLAAYSRDPSGSHRGPRGGRRVRESPASSWVGESDGSTSISWPRRWWSGARCGRPTPASQLSPLSCASRTRRFDKTAGGPMTPRETILDLKAAHGALDHRPGGDHRAPADRPARQRPPAGRRACPASPRRARSRASRRTSRPACRASSSRPTCCRPTSRAPRSTTRPTGKSEFRFEQGPIFDNLVLADEINRAPAKVQAALLEAMEERQVTVAGKTHPLPPLFLVMATQNPIEQEGTYPLPEAQMDRFLMHVLDRLPRRGGREADRAAGAQRGGPPRRRTARRRAAPVAAAGGLRRPRARSTRSRWRTPSRTTSSTSSSRRAIPSATATSWQVDPGRRQPARRARARPLLRAPTPGSQGRDHVTPDDVRAVVARLPAPPVILSYEASADGLSADDVVSEGRRQGRRGGA